jgi:hypothetical protein
VSDHPLADMIPTMIENMGFDRALDWWMRWGVELPGSEPYRLSKDAIEELARGNEDFVLMDDNGEDVARAFQWVRIFSLERFVTWRSTAAPS